MKGKLFLGVIISAIFLYLALREIDWGQFGGVIQETNPWWALLGAFFLMLGHYIRAYRWKFILLPIQPVRTWSAFSATSIGLAFNNLLPARLGEVVRAIAIARTEGISKSASFATIVYERVVDVFSLIALLWFSLLKVEGPVWLQRSGILLVILNVVLMVVLYVMVRYQSWFMTVMDATMRVIPAHLAGRVRRWTESFIDGLAVLKSKSALGPMIITSIGVWAAATLGIYFCTLALNIDVPVMASIILIVLISLGTMIPSGPAYVGPVQYACILGLGIYGVDKSEALAYSILFHASHFIPITLTGLYFSWRSHIGLSEATNQGKAIDDQPL